MEKAENLYIAILITLLIVTVVLVFLSFYKKKTYRYYAIATATLLVGAAFYSDLLLQNKQEQMTVEIKEDREVWLDTEVREHISSLDLLKKDSIKVDINTKKELTGQEKWYEVNSTVYPEKLQYVHIASEKDDLIYEGWAVVDRELPPLTNPYIEFRNLTNHQIATEIAGGYYDVKVYLPKDYKD